MRVVASRNHRNLLHRLKEFRRVHLAFSRECGTIAAILTLGEICGPWTDYTDLRSTVPSKDQVLVPETLLKKRKSQEQARAVRLEELQKRKEVSIIFLFCFCYFQ